MSARVHVVMHMSAGARVVAALMRVMVADHRTRRVRVPGLARRLRSVDPANAGLSRNPRNAGYPRGNETTRHGETSKVR